MKTHSTNNLHFGKTHKHSAHPHTKAFGNKFLPVKSTASSDKKHEELRKSAEKWVGQTFYGQMLKQMRDSPFKVKEFEGGRGGEAFGAMFDQHLADRMSKGAGKPLVNAIVNRIEAGKAYTPLMRGSKMKSVQAPPASSYQGVM